MHGLLAAAARPPRWTAPALTPVPNGGPVICHCNRLKCRPAATQNHSRISPRPARIRTATPARCHVAGESGAACTAPGEPAAPALEATELAQCLAAAQSLEHRGQHSGAMQLLSHGGRRQSPLGIVVMDISGRVE